MNLTDARQAIADALGTLDGLATYPRPIKTPRALDAWVTLTRIVPSTFSACRATFTAVICLGPDEAKAEELFESLGVAAINAVTTADSLNPADVSLEAQAIVGQANVPGPLYIIALTLTLEVD